MPNRDVAGESSLAASFKADADINRLKAADCFAYFSITSVFLLFHWAIFYRVKNVTLRFRAAFR